MFHRYSVWRWRRYQHQLPVEQREKLKHFPWKNALFLAMKNDGMACNSTAKLFRYLPVNYDVRVLLFSAKKIIKKRRMQVAESQRVALFSIKSVSISFFFVHIPSSLASYFTLSRRFHFSQWNFLRANTIQFSFRLDYFFLLDSPLCSLFNFRNVWTPMQFASAEK